MPVYDLSAVAHALEITPKQLDNLLSRNELDGVERKARGVTRRITANAAIAINVAWQLSTSAQIPIATALELARRLVDSSDHIVVIGAFLTISLDFGELRSRTLERLDLAVEAVGRRRRGRPPRTARAVRSGP